MEALPTLYKIVGPAGEPLNGGSGTWPLPVDGKPGEWWDIDGPLEACRHGLHLTDADHLSQWLPGNRPAVVYQAETRGPVINAGEKYVAASVRLLPRSRPMPDFDAAERKRKRAIARAGKLLDVAVPPVWRAYLLGVGTLPAGHPGAVYQTRLRDARDAHAAAVRKAEDTYRRAIMPGRSL